MFGVSRPEDAVGKQVQQFTHPDVRDAANDRLRVVRESGLRLDSVKSRLIRGDGTIVNVLFSAFPVIY